MPDATTKRHSIPNDTSSTSTFSKIRIRNRRLATREQPPHESGVSEGEWSAEPLLRPCAWFYTRE